METNGKTILSRALNVMTVKLVCVKALFEGSSVVVLVVVVDPLQILAYFL